MRVWRVSGVAGALMGAALLGLGCSDPPPKNPSQGEQVPANSLDSERLNGTNTKPMPSDDEGDDPSQPLVQHVGDNSDDPAAAPSASSSSATKSGKPDKPAKGAVSKAECDKVMDKYISLEIASNPQLKGVSQDVIDQAKQMAKQQHGDAPCTATRAQYTCAMAATTSATWQKCMK